VANSRDKIFKYVYNKDWNSFWNADKFAHITRNQAGDANLRFREFKDLMENMITFNPADRFTAQQLGNHPWFKDQSEYYA